MAAEPEILSHWSTLIDGLTYSSKEFYAQLEGTIRDRNIPKAKTSTVEFSEGGVLSAKRLYFRVQRGEHTFDVCAAPFGRGFFVSWWLLTPARPSPEPYFARRGAREGRRRVRIRRPRGVPPQNAPYARTSAMSSP